MTLSEHFELKRSSTEGKERVGLSTGEWQEPGETSFKIQKRMGITDATRSSE